MNSPESSAVRLSVSPYSNSRVGDSMEPCNIRAGVGYRLPEQATDTLRGVQTQRGVQTL